MGFNSGFKGLKDRVFFLVPRDRNSMLWLKKNRD